MCQALVALNLFFVALQSAAIQFEKKSQFEKRKNGSLRRKSLSASATAWVSYFFIKFNIQQVQHELFSCLNVRSTLLSEEIEDFSLFIFSVLFEEEERAQGAQKVALRRQIDALELEVLRNLRLQRDQMILENERMERLLQLLENPQNP